MPNHARPPLLRYGVVPLAVALAMLLRWPLAPALGEEFAFLFLWPVVLFCAWYGGLGPGLLATALSALAAAFFLLEPRFSLSVIRTPDTVGLAVFVFVGVVVSLLNEQLHRGRRQVEQQARELLTQREWLRVSLTSIGDAVIATDTGGRVTFLNPIAESLTGWDQEAARGQPLEKVFVIHNELTRQPVEAPVARVLREGVVVGLANHTALVARDGTERPIEDTAAPIKDGRGELLGVILVFHDVTEKRRQERAVEGRRQETLRQTEERFRLLVEGVRDYAIYLLDPEGRVATWNPGAAHIKGYAADEVLGTHFSRFYPEEAKARGWPAQELERAAAEGRFEDEGWRVRKDGSRFWANVVITALRDAAGRLRGFAKVTRDLTERKEKEETLHQLHQDLERRVRDRTAALAAANEALRGEVAERQRVEEALRHSEERLRTLADSIPQLAWTARPDGHIDWYNRRWYEYTGTTPEQTEGWGWQSVHDPQELPRVLERWRASLATGEPFDMVFPMRGADGRFRPFLTRVLPLRGEAGRILQWFGTNTDITEIQEMEAALREADRRKDQFLAMLAHELRNPLAPVRNALEILKSSRADRSAVEKARAMMDRQIRHMARIVDDLLDVSRLTRGKFALRTERLDLARLVRVTLEDHEAALAAAGLRVAVDVPEVPVWVQGDATRLTQVLGNLLLNAIKFTPRDGRVAVLLAADAARAQALLTVRDTGVGIEPDMLPRLFETFAQADCSLDRSKGGLGLGLALVKGLVELHGGEVHAASEGPGRGAELVVRLPTQAEPAALTGLPETLGDGQKKLRILVVEDNRDAADSLRLLLELYGYDVTVAYTGPAGVEKAKEWRPDVVLCDIGLPGLDGYGVVRALRRDPTTSAARMIAVTGYGSEEDRQRSQDAGFDVHLTKPVDPAALQEVVAASN